MRALRFHGARDLRLDEVPVPGVLPGTVRVAVEWCGICGSDLNEYVAGPLAIPTAGAPHPLTAEHLPLTMGHEFAGTIVEVGDGVPSARIGERVAVNPLLADGTCERCRRGQPQLCAQLGFVGLSGRGGGFADEVVVAAEAAHHLPQSIETEIGALVEPLAVAWHAVALSGAGEGDSALVLGAGPIGLATVLALRARGCARIVVSDPVAERRSVAAALGATLILNPAEQDATAAAMEATDGQGVHAAFDAAGVGDTLTTALMALRPGGTAVNLAVWKQPPTLDPMVLMLGEKRVVGSVAYDHDFPAVIDAIASGRIDPRPMITSRVGLEHVVARGFEQLAAATSSEIKILVRP
jgi:(R,R)-butanediol dehydrogenase/meso-butanediol dehydrogenase/diacetyl reductase